MQTLLQNRNSICATSGRVFNIQRFCIHDGPGIRTTVFLKGCSLRCRWCHNPEGIGREPVILFDPRLCIGCGRCINVCPSGAHFRDDEGKVRFDRKKCQTCGRCAEECSAEALTLAGKAITAGEVLDVVLRDKPFYENSRGGVTLSGGEPLLQPEFAEAILALSRAEGIATAVETSSYAPWEDIERLAPYIDLWLCDLKHVDLEKHRRFTGVNNAIILKNLVRMSCEGYNVNIRIPLIPGFNDSREELSAIGEFIMGLPRRPGVEVLPYHRVGESKYQRMGLDYSFAGQASMRVEEASEIVQVLKNLGLNVSIE